MCWLAILYRVGAHDGRGRSRASTEKGRDVEDKLVYKDVALTECIRVDSAMGIEGFEYKCHYRRDVMATSSPQRTGWRKWLSLYVAENKLSQVRLTMLPDTPFIRAKKV